MAKRRILLKLSGEILAGKGLMGINPKTLEYVIGEIKPLAETGIQIALVVGGGNLFRGKSLAELGLDRVSADHMGMLATIMNGIALRDCFERRQMATRLMAAVPMPGIVESYDRRLAAQALGQGYVVIVAGGTGNPFFSTDTAACLRAVELQAEVLVKATKVDGVYDKDPILFKEAKRYLAISYDDVLTKRLEVIDGTALVLAREQGLPIRIFDLANKGSLEALAKGEAVGTLIGENLQGKFDQSFL